jgi:DNA-directed RNA polymerase specialized sigma24 family protein
MITNEIVKIENSNPDEIFEQMCEETYDDLMKYALWLTRGNKYSAEEIVQNTYEIAKKKQYVILSHPNPAGWLSLTAQNYNTRHIKEMRKINEYEIELVYDAPYEIDTYDDLTFEILERLTEQEQQFFIDHYEHNISIAEMARRDMGSYDSLKKYNIRLKTKISKMLELPKC